MQSGEGRQLRGSGAPRQGPQSSALRGAGNGGGKAKQQQPAGGASGGSSSSSSSSSAGAAPSEAAKADGFYGSMTAAAADPGRWFRKTARWLETSDDTDPVVLMTLCCDDFKPRKVKAPLVLGWLVMQILGILFQYSLYEEVSMHLSEFEETLQTYCNKEHWQQDVCLGPAWNLSFGEVLHFPATDGSIGSDFDFVIPADQSFNFVIRSEPPTFLVGVEPKTPASWRLDIEAEGRSRSVRSWKSDYSGVLPEMHSGGRKYKVYTTKYHGNGRWIGSMSLKSKQTYPSDIRVYVVDSRIQHLEDIHKQPQCSFEDSWLNFNERRSGMHHKVMSNAQAAIWFFLMISVVSTVFVLYRFYFYVEAGKLLNRIIIAKFLIQDFPQQMCIVVYLYGWYASNGLRCQMCLFHPTHCDDEFPLHWSNLMVCIFTLLSATSNQFLLQAKARIYDEEEECFLAFIRCSMFSVSVLPFSTSLFFLSYSLLHLRSVPVYILAGVPTLLGWATVLCAPMFAFCDDSDFQP